MILRWASDSISRLVEPASSRIRVVCSPRRGGGPLRPETPENSIGRYRRPTIPGIFQTFARAQPSCGSREIGPPSEWHWRELPERSKTIEPIRRGALNQQKPQRCVQRISMFHTSGIGRESRIVHQTGRFDTGVRNRRSFEMPIRCASRRSRNRRRERKRCAESLAAADRALSLPGDQVVCHPHDAGLKQRSVDARAAAGALAHRTVPRQYPSAIHIPVPISRIETPARAPAVPGSPVTLWFRCAPAPARRNRAFRNPAPRRPNAERDAKIRSARAPRTADSPNPIDSAFPPRKFSTNTSHDAAKRAPPRRLPVAAQIQRYGTLAAIDSHGNTRSTIGGGSHLARFVAGAGPLDFQHFGAEPGQDHGRRRTGNVSGEIENADSASGRHALMLAAEEAFQGGDQCADYDMRKNP